MNLNSKPSSTYYFYKNVLLKVSFDTNLFVKELKKAISVLSKQEGVRLYNWALSFSKSQPELHLSLDYII